MLYEQYIIKITNALNKRDLYEKNEDFSEDLANYIRDKLARRNEQFQIKDVTMLIIILGVMTIKMSVSNLTITLKI